jgi:signal transduction histidine kinase
MSNHDRSSLSPSVLVVDEDATRVSRLVERLTATGFRMLVSTGPLPDAARLSTLHRPDLALVCIERSDGGDAIELSCSLWRELAVPVVFLTCQLDAVALRRANQAAPLAFLSTPYTDQELVDVVTTALTRIHSERRTREADAWLKSPSERSRLEQRLRHVQRHENVELLAAGVAHDVSNLLLVILGRASLATEDAAHGSNVVGELAQIALAAERAAALCSQLMAHVSKEGAALRPLQLNRSVEETLHLLQVSLAKNAVLKLDLESDLPPVLVDHAQLQQVAMNLILNAVESLDGAPGTVTIRTRRRALTSDALARLQIGDELSPGEYLMLEVADTGSGMTPDTLRQIFDPFFTTKLTGRGLGLAAVQAIVRAHGAGLEVRTTLHHGTSFRLWLRALQGKP